MEKQMIFHILGIEETKEERTIQEAYRNLLKVTNPEDDPEGFRRLREAYEGALSLARQRTAEEEEPELTQIQQWVQEADELYCDMKRRFRVSSWKRLLDDPVCEELDTSLDVRNALLTYLMNHIYLPQTVWQCLDKKFQLREDMEHLKQEFPVNFLDYVVYQIEHKEFMNYELFTVEAEEKENGDGWLEHYFEIKRMMDDGNTDGIWQKLDDLSAFGLSHPFADTEQMRALLAEGKLEEAGGMAEKLAGSYPNESYIQFHAGNVWWAQGHQEEAGTVWKKILEENPDHYMAKTGLIRYEMEKGRLTEAKELMMEQMERSSHDETILELLKTANDILIPQYQKKLEEAVTRDRQWKEDAIELGWCLFQNEQQQEACTLMQSFEPEEDQKYGYVNLLGRICYQLERYEEARPYLEQWVHMIRNTVDDGSAENQKRISRYSRACHILGGCYFEMGDREKAIEILQEAVEKADKPQDRLMCRQYLGHVYLKSGQYEMCIDLCDQIIQEEDQYFPAYLQRQEAYFELKNGQKVVDDYHNAVEIFGGYYKPYLLAAQVFFYCDQYEDGKQVLDRARENGVQFSSRMRLFEVKILRNLAEGEEDRKRPIEICRELLSEEDHDDIEDPSEILFELAVLCWDNHDNQSALSHLNKAIAQNEERMQYQMVKGNILREMEHYEEALVCYEQAKKQYQDTPGLYYNMGLCYEAQGFSGMAKECYEHVLTLRDSYADTLERLGDLHWGAYKKEGCLADYIKALEYITRGIEVEETCYDLVHRGLIYMEAMELEKAIADYEKALEHRPDDWAAYNNLGYCYKHLGDYQKSIEMYHKAIECFGEEKKILPYSNMADCYEILGEYEKAIECYKKDLEWFPKEQSFWKEIGDLYSYLGEYEKARAAYDQVSQRYDYEALTGGLWIRQNRRWRGLWSYIKGVLKKKDDSWWELAGCLEGNAFGWSHLALLCYRDAVSVEKDPYERFLKEKDLAWCYYCMGKKKQAKKHAQEALEYFEHAKKGTIEDYLGYPAFGPVRKGIMGRLFLCLGETEKALTCFEEMDQTLRCKNCRYQECYEKYLHLSEYYEANGHLEKAVECIKKAVERNSHSVSMRKTLERLQKRLHQG